MPVTLKDPQDNGAVRIYHGDPAVLRLVIPDEDLSSRSFFADIRKSTKTDVITSWAVSVAWDPGEEKTTITMALTGDSSTGALDGQSRLVPKKAVTDLQEVDTNGVVIRTIARADLIGVEDVTR